MNMSPPSGSHQNSGREVGGGGGVKCVSATHQNYRMCLGGDGDGVKRQKECLKLQNYRAEHDEEIGILLCVNHDITHRGTETPHGTDYAAGRQGMTSKRATSCKEKSKEGGVTGAGEDK